MEEHHMAKTIRKFSDQEKMRYLAEYKALRMAEGITVEGFAARAGLSHHTVLHARVDPVLRPVVPLRHQPPGYEGDLVDDLVPVPEIGVGGVPVVADVEHGGVGGCRAQGGPRLGLLPEMGFHGALLILGPGCGERLELREQRFHLLGGRHVPHGRAEPDELAQLGDQPVPLAHLLGEIQDDFPELVPVLAL